VAAVSGLDQAGIANNGVVEFDLRSPAFGDDLAWTFVIDKRFFEFDLAIVLGFDTSEVADDVAIKGDLGTPAVSPDRSTNAVDDERAVDLDLGTVSAAIRPRLNTPSRSNVTFEPLSSASISPVGPLKTRDLSESGPSRCVWPRSSPDYRCRPSRTSHRSPRPLAAMVPRLSLSTVDFSKRNLAADARPR